VKILVFPFLPRLGHNSEKNILSKNTSEPTLDTKSQHYS